MTSDISAREADELRKTFSGKGLAALQSLIGHKLTDWQHESLNIGVIGRSGVGKSSFINAIRHMTADEKGGAAVGVTETTVQMRKYCHPKNEKLVFCDLPGVGTSTFPKESYLRQINLRQFDCFVLLTASRFTEDETWLAKEIRREQKAFFFVRTKIDADVEGKRKAYRNNKPTEQEIVTEIRDDCTKHLEKAGFRDAHCYLVDNYERKAFDFEKLEQNLSSELQELKRQALVISWDAESDKMIDLKAEILKERIWKAALLCSVVNVVPVPGLSFAFDMSTMIRETTFYFEQLGLDDKSLERLASIMHVDARALKRIVTEENVTTYMTAEGVKRVALSAPEVAVGTVAMAVYAVLRLIPIAGSAVSYHTMHYVLTSTLEQYETAARKVMRYVGEHTYMQS